MVEGASFNLFLGVQVVGMATLLAAIDPVGVQVGVTLVTVVLMSSWQRDGS